jgi:hypothetical protein
VEVCKWSSSQTLSLVSTPLHKLYAVTLSAKIPLTPVTMPKESSIGEKTVSLA